MPKVRTDFSHMKSFMNKDATKKLMSKIENIKMYITPNLNSSHYKGTLKRMAAPWGLPSI